MADIAQADTAEQPNVPTATEPHPASETNNNNSSSNNSNTTSDSNENNTSLFSTSDDDVCRICRAGAEANRPLYHPCACSGSIKYVHEDCLLKWIKHSQASQCELCKKQFNFLKGSVLSIVQHNTAYSVLMIVIKLLFFYC